MKNKTKNITITEEDIYENNIIKNWSDSYPPGFNDIKAKELGII